MGVVLFLLFFTYVKVTFQEHFTIPIYIFPGFHLNLTIAWYITLVCMELVISGHSDIVLLLQVSFVGMWWTGDVSVKVFRNLLQVCSVAKVKVYNISIKYFMQFASFSICWYASWIFYVYIFLHFIVQYYWTILLFLVAFFLFGVNASFAENQCF